MEILASENKEKMKQDFKPKPQKIQKQQRINLTQDFLTKKRIIQSQKTLNLNKVRPMLPESDDENEENKDQDQQMENISSEQNIGEKDQKIISLFQQPNNNLFKQILEDPAIQSELQKLPVTLIKSSTAQFQYGNYKTYYHYRHDQQWQDPRVNILEKKFFLNKDVLDIGCNDGSLTLLLAIKYFPRQIIGVDIDYNLINAAIDNFIELEKNHAFHSQSSIVSESIEAEQKREKLIEKLSRLPMCFLQNFENPNSLLDKQLGTSFITTSTEEIFSTQKGDQEKEASLDKNDQNISKHQEENNQIAQNKEDNSEKVQKEIEITNRFPDNINFQIENYVQNLELTQMYDTIMCLSTTKWIHLNYGDVGIKRLFHQIYQSLRPSGYFILQPQQWKSYQKKKNLTPTIRENYQKIELQPQFFEFYLVQTLGFTLEKEINPDESASKTGFKRTLYIYQKILK